MKLQYRVPLLSAAIVLVIGLAAVPPLLYQLRRASVEQFGAMAAGVAQVLEGHLEASAASGGGHSVDQAVDELRGYPLLEEVVVFSSAGVAEASLNTAITGAPTDDARVAGVLGSGKSLTQSNSQDGANRLDVITPILNKPACQGCHGSERTVLGAMLVSLNTASQDAELRQQLLIVCLTGLVAFGLIELALTLSLKETVLNPLSRLGEAAGRISRGDYSATAIVERDDEVGVLALALNQMAERVAEHTADLQERDALNSTRLREANREVTALLGRAVAGGFDVRFDNPHLVRCWEENQCAETGCPAYGAANLRCWQIDGTLCHGGPSGKPAKKAIDCQSCRVYAKGCNRDEITSIGESFNNMMFLLDFEAKQRAEMASQHIEKLMAAQEEERKRVARELHDETAQSLTSLLVGLKTLEGVRSTKDFRGHVERLERQTLGALDEVRRLALELRPAALDELGLAAALRGYLRETMSRYEVEIDFRADGLGARLSPGLETALYRIVQESVANAIRHGEARRIEVSLEQRPSAIVARVRDDGKGFSMASLGRNGAPRHPTSGHGLGLIGMRERATLFGGRVRVESQPGAGTTVSAEIPLVEALEVCLGGANGTRR